MVKTFIGVTWGVIAVLEGLAMGAAILVGPVAGFWIPSLIPRWRREKRRGWRTIGLFWAIGFLIPVAMIGAVFFQRLPHLPTAIWTVLWPGMWMLWVLSSYSPWKMYQAAVCLIFMFCNAGVFACYALVCLHALGRLRASQRTRA